MARDTYLKRLKDSFKSKVQRSLAEPYWDIELARQRRACDETAAFVDEHMPRVPSYADKFALLSVSVGARTADPTGLICEFGVFQGRTINYVASLVGQTVHGFDSFEGLPEDWRADVSKSAFALHGLPQVNQNVSLHKGWFADTVPSFLKEHSGRISFLHVDCDLYSSTKTILDLMGERLVVGTVIQFDEYFNYPGWQVEEHLAFTEFCKSRGAKVEYLGYSRQAEQVALRIVAIDR